MNPTAIVLGIAGILLVVGILGTIGIVPLATANGSSCTQYEVLCYTENVNTHGFVIYGWINGTLVGGWEILNQTHSPTTPWIDTGYAPMISVVPSTGPCVTVGCAQNQTYETFATSVVNGPVSTTSPSSLTTFSISFAFNVSTTSPYGAIGLGSGPLGNGSYTVDPQIPYECVVFNKTGCYGGTSGATAANPSIRVDGIRSIGISLPSDSSTSGSQGCPGANCYAVTAGFVSSVSGFTASFKDNSTLAGAKILSIEWKFGDGSSGNGSKVSHAYLASGSFPVTEVVTVAPSNGAVAAGDLTSSYTGVVLIGSGSNVTTFQGSTNSISSGLALLSPLDLAFLIGPIATFVALAAPPLRNPVALGAILVVFTILGYVLGFVVGGGVV